MTREAAAGGGDGGPQGPPVLCERRAGILLHPTSLPGAPVLGVLGEAAHRFVDLLAEAGVHTWQVLPLGPTHDGGSPYQCQSVHAGNPDLVDLRDLAARGWLPGGAPDLDAAVRDEVLATAWQGFLAQADAAAREAFERFRAAQAHWLEDWCLFKVARLHNARRAWWEWEPALRDREPAALAALARARAGDIERVRFEQFAFDLQWQALRARAAARGVSLFGDMPIFVAEDSAEVWAERDYFRLDASGRPAFVAGVPPDYFSATGQRWGNPLYDWERMRADGYAWWRRRLAGELRLHDLVRVDHFRGFAAFWEIPASEPTAVHGRWVEAPGAELFAHLLAHFGRLPLVAEDLGTITPDVNALRLRFGLPGMKVLQFAFGGDAANPYLPHNHEPNSVAYTGTHDNDTTAAWVRAAPAQVRAHAAAYLAVPQMQLPQALVRAALASVARLAVLPMQDVLGLGAGNRMNMPGSKGGNWRWRFAWSQVRPDTVAHLRRLNEVYERSGGSTS